MNHADAVLRVDGLLLDGGRGNLAGLRDRLARIDRGLLLEGLYCRLRARGVSSGEARTEAVEMAAECLASPGIETPGPGPAPRKACATEGCAHLLFVHKITPKGRGKCSAAGCLCKAWTEPAMAVA